MVKNEGDLLTRAVVCPPRTEYFNVDDVQKHNIIQIADKVKAIQQHEILRSNLTGFGVEVIEIDELPGHPNSVFTRDMAVSTPEGYIKLRMGIESRRGEEKWMSKYLENMGEPCIGEVQEPGTAEGGDIILAGSTAFVGVTDRTNITGMIHLSGVLQKMGYEIRKVRLPNIYLHLDQAIGVLGPDLLICCRKETLFPDDFFKGFEVINFQCAQFNVNCICLGEREIIVPASNTRLIQEMTKLDIRLHALDLSEFAKGTGGPNCLIMPLERK